MPICAKTISFWVRKVLGIAKDYMFPSTFSGAVVLATLVAGVSLMSILQAGDWAKFLPSEILFFYLCDYYQLVLGFC